jgi:hypothetical protein
MTVDKEAEAGMSFFITKAQKAELQRLGYSDEQIREMKPEDAHTFAKPVISVFPVRRSKSVLESPQSRLAYSADRLAELWIVEPEIGAFSSSGPTRKRSSTASQIFYRWRTYTGVAMTILLMSPTPSTLTSAANMPPYTAIPSTAGNVCQSARTGSTMVCQI